MGGGEEAGVGFLDVDSEQAHLRPEQRGQRVLGGEVDVEPARKALGARGETPAFQTAVQPVDQSAHARRQVLLKRRSLGLEMLKHRLGGGQHEGMAHEGAGEERRGDFRHRFVAEPPGAAVQRIHEARLAGEYADGHAATHHLAVGGEVRADAEERLRASLMGAEAGDDLVEHEGRALGFGDLAQSFQEGDGAQGRVAALHRLDHHGRDIVTVGLDPVEALRIAVGQDGHVGDGFGRNARGRRQGAGRRATAGSHQHLVELTMVVVAEHDDALATGDGARDAHCGHHRLGARVAEGHALVAGHFSHKGCDLAGQRGLRPDREALFELCRDRCRDELRRMTEHRLAIAIDEIDVLVAVDVPDLRSLRLGGDQRIDQFLPFTAEARHRARIGKGGAILLGLCLGQRRALVDASHQVVDVGALGLGQGLRPDCRNTLDSDAGLDLCARQGSGNRRRRAGGRRVPEGGICRRRCRIEMGGQALDRWHVAQQLPKGDPGLELLFQGARDLAEQQRVEAEGGEVFTGIDVIDARQLPQDIDDRGLERVEPRCVCLGRRRCIRLGRRRWGRLFRRGRHLGSDRSRAALDPVA